MAWSSWVSCSNEKHAPMASVAGSPADWVPASLSKSCAICPTSCSAPPPLAGYKLTADELERLLDSLDPGNTGEDGCFGLLRVGRGGGDVTRYVASRRQVDRLA